MRTFLLGLFALAVGCISVGGGGTPATRVPATKMVGAGRALRVMTFNVRYGTADDGDNAWANRRGIAVRVIREFGPDVLGLQEALRFQLDELGRELSVYGEVGVGRDDGAREGEYAAILYDRRRLELLGDGHFWLSDSPELPGSMTWGNRYPRIVTWARFRDRTAGATFLAVNTHWDHESQEARLNGARLMRHRLLGSGEPLLVMGDLNCAADNPAFRLLLERPPGVDDLEEQPAWLADTFAALFPRGVAGSGTFHAFSGNRDGAKIDFVLVWPLRERYLAGPPAGASKEWRVLQADIVHTSEGGRYPSDHFPVTAVVMLVDVAE